jgi:hypothetical protein
MMIGLQTVMGSARFHQTEERIHRERLNLYGGIQSHFATSTLPQLCHGLFQLFWADTESFSAAERSCSTDNLTALHQSMSEVEVELCQWDAPGRIKIRRQLTQVCY